jgi:hypothetical protein
MLLRRCLKIIVKHQIETALMQFFVTRSPLSDFAFKLSLCAVKSAHSSFAVHSYTPLSIGNRELCLFEYQK